MVDVVGGELSDDSPMAMAHLDVTSMESGGALGVSEVDQPKRPLPEGTVTFLLTDVAGSTRLWESDEESAAAAISRQFELVYATIALHGGLRPIEQGEGDSAVGVFESAVDAVEAALEAQRALAVEPWPTESGLWVRMALHTGQARLRDEGNYSGATIIRSARLRSLAHGGQVLLSDVTRDLVVDHLPDGATVRSLGAHRLKDLTRPERVWQLCHPELVVEFPPLGSLDSFPNNLPAQLNALVGRQRELAGLLEMLGEHRLVTLTGAGGCGKTRLAAQLAAEVVEGYPGGAWWVELAAMSDPEALTAAVATAVGVRVEPERPLIDTLCEYLDGLDALIVLDNCEHLLAAAADLADRLVRSVPTVTLLATSREPLGITGELAWRVPPLEAESAVQLFVERANLVRPGFTTDQRETEIVARICDRLDGLPLAIELAAARTRLMRPAAIAAALDDRFRLLTGGTRTAQPRQQTLEASVAWSYDLLEEPEQALLRRLSVFNGGFSLAAAETVGADGMVDGYAVMDLLGHLVDKSLVQADDLGEEIGYRLLDTIRHFGRARLVDSGETDQVRDRHLGWYLAYAERAAPELGTGSGPAWANKLELEHANLQAALDWADTTGQHETVLRLATALSLFWEYRGHRHQAIGGRWFARALAVNDGPSVVRARALWAAAHMGIYSGDLNAVLAFTPQALEVAQTVGDQQTLARAGNTLNYARSLSSPEEGLAGLAGTIDLARSIGDEWAVADGLKMMSISWAVRGDHDRTLETGEQLGRIASRLGSKFFLAWSQTLTAYVALRRGDFRSARHELDRSIALCDEVGDPITRWLNICFLGEIEAQTGRYDRARAHYEQVLHKGVAFEGDLARHFAIPDLAALLLALGDVSGASQVLEPAVSDFENELPLIRIPFLIAHSQWLRETGDEAGGHRDLINAREAAVRAGNEPLLAQVDFELADLARRQGDMSRAEDLCHDAMALFVKHRIVPDIARSLEALAEIAANQESGTEGTRLFAAAAAVRASINLARAPMQQATYQADLAAARTQLGDAGFAAAWNEGESLTIDEAVSYASRARGERKRPSTGWASLTPTELDVVKLIAKGLSNPEIGAQLFIGRATVKTHLSHVFTKLGVTGRAELASEATRRGI
jgi:predicted ATPase/class 3 adenylate cyclase/DNA-binding CsgD family transcriptional regulator